MLKKFVLSLLFGTVCCFSTQVEASPVTHASLAKKFLDTVSFYDEPQQLEFIIGATFPDIRYLYPGIPALEPIYNVTIDDVLSAPTPFSAGFLFHSFVVQHREHYSVQDNSYGYLSTFNPPKATTQLHLIEDEITYKLTDWRLIRKAPRNIYPEEHNFGIPADQIQFWHELIGYCFSYSPNMILKFLDSQNTGLLDLEAHEIKRASEIVGKLSKDTTMKNHVTAQTSYFMQMFFNAKKRR